MGEVADRRRSRCHKTVPDPH